MPQPNNPSTILKKYCPLKQHLLELLFAFKDLKRVFMKESYNVWILLQSNPLHTVCPRGFDPFFYNNLLYKMGQGFLNIE